MKHSVAVLSGVAVLAFLAALLALLLPAPEADPLRLGISFYAHTRFRLLIGVPLSVAGMGGILLGAARWHPRQTAAHLLGLALLVLWGISSIIAGIFPLDPIGAEQTLSGAIHNLAGLNFLLIAPAVFLIGSTEDRVKRSSIRLPRIPWVKWAFLLIVVVLFVFNGPLAPVGIGGLIQRFYWLLVCVWLLARVRELLKGQESSAAPEVQAA